MAIVSISKEPPAPWARLCHLFLAVHQYLRGRSPSLTLQFPDLPPFIAASCALYRAITGISPRCDSFCNQDWLAPAPNSIATWGEEPTAGAEQLIWAVGLNNCCVDVQARAGAWDLVKVEAREVALQHESEYLHSNL